MSSRWRQPILMGFVLALVILSFSVPVAHHPPGAVAAPPEKLSVNQPAPTVIPPCKDATYRSHNNRVVRPIVWRYNPRSQTVGGALAAIWQGEQTWHKVRNNCELRPEVLVPLKFAGRTTRTAQISTYGTCSKYRDGYSTISWKPLKKKALAVTCTWVRGRQIVEVDQVYNTTSNFFHSTVPEGCKGRRYSLRATATHEWGHALGFGHIGGNRHRNLTMHPFVAICANHQSTLARGEVLAVAKKYSRQRATKG